MKYILIILTLLFSNLSYAFKPDEKPINVIIPFPPGGGVDQTFRHFEKYLNAKNIKLIANYKPGANGIIGLTEFQNVSPDGYTIFLGTAGTIAEYLHKNPNKNVVPVSMIRTSIMTVLGKPNANIKTFSNLEAAIKNNERLLFSYNAPGQKLVIDQILEKYDLNKNIELVTYKGATQMLQELSGSHVDISVTPFSVAKPFIDANKITLLAIDNDTNIEKYTTTLLPKYYNSWTKIDGFVVALPNGTPTPIIDTWSNIMREYLSDPTVLKDFKQDYMTPLTFGRAFADQMIKLSLLKIK